MQSVLGIDPGWTPGKPSAVALIVEGEAGQWRCRRLAPSYTTFADIAGTPTAHGIRPGRETLRVGIPEVLAAAEALCGGSVSVIAVDMPLARGLITARRHADNLISRTFGRFACGTHSPTPDRPGALAGIVRAACEESGYPLATAENQLATSRGLIEVYPHLAILSMLQLRMRWPYKVTRTRKYWPHLPAVGDRVAHLLKHWHVAIENLQVTIGGIPSFVPASEDGATLSSLKYREDILDALICAWIGVQYLLGNCRPYGDGTAAIWALPPSAAWVRGPEDFGLARNP